MLDKKNKYSVDIIGTPTGSSGWATHTMEFARAMENVASINLRSKRFNSLQLLFGQDRNMLLRGLLKNDGDFCVIVNGKSKNFKSSARWIVWETTELPQSQKKLCEGSEYLWTPSQWGRNNLINNGYAAERIFVVPEGVNTEFYTPTAGATNKPKFRFLLTGKWEERKFTAQLVKTFLKEFKSHEPVELYLQAHNKFIKNFSIEHELKKLGISNLENIVIGKPCNTQALRELYRSADCFVLPTRAEGWGLPILESMACGVPAIVTQYSAPLDYFTHDNGYFIKVKKMVPAYDPIFNVNTGMWAEPDEEDLAAQMRLAYEKKSDLREKGRQAHLDAQKFSWHESAAKAITLIDRLLAKK